MRRTFVTRVEDRAGSFLKAARAVASHGGNIARTSYNRTVDSRTVFMDVTAGSEEDLDAITADLEGMGYLRTGEDEEVLLLELRLMDVPGAIVPALEVLDRHGVNISYMNAREDGGPYQSFAMGIYLESTAAAKAVLEELSGICQVTVRDYSATDLALDNTVFYITFADDIRRMLSLDDVRAREVLIASNMAMQHLESTGGQPAKTFAYIRRFAEDVAAGLHGGFSPVTDTMDLPGGRRLHMFEPPCGSTTYVLESDEEQLFVDGGFSCFSDAMMRIVDSACPARGRRRVLAITHSDVDHTGLWPFFDRILASGAAADDIRRQHEGGPALREADPRHAPYYRLSKAISGHRIPDPDRIEAIGRRSGDGTYESIGSFEACGLVFEACEGNGGHIPGDTVFACRELRIVFTGDDLINPGGSSESQSEFNTLAPYLMESVNTNSAKARECRKRLTEMFGGWTACPGHGSWMTIRNA